MGIKGSNNELRWQITTSLIARQKPFLTDRCRPNESRLRFGFRNTRIRAYAAAEVREAIGTSNV